jgi:glycosyltransferase involved in cell wall biosynthesis
VPALGAALRRLLADADLRRRMGEAGRARVQERFTWDVVSDATLEAYRDALGEAA